MKNGSVDCDASEQIAEALATAAAAVVVADRSLIAAVDVTNFQTGQRLTELETESWWVLQAGSVPGSSTATVAIATDSVSDTRHWARVPGSGKDSYKYQTTWYVDPILGSDRYAGTALLPLASVAEMRQRIWGDQRGNMTCYIVGNTTNVYRGFASQFQMTFEGVPVETALVATTNTTPTGTESNTLTCSTAITWTTYRGQIVKKSSLYAVVLKDLTGNKARLGQWSFSNGQSGQVNSPLAGSFTILTLPTITLGDSNAVITGSTRERNVFYKFVKVVVPRTAAYYILCQVTKSNGGSTLDQTADGTFYPDEVFRSCSITTSSNYYLVCFTGNDFYGCSFFNFILRVSDRIMNVPFTVWQGVGIYINHAYGGSSTKGGPVGGGITSLGGSEGSSGDKFIDGSLIGVFDAPDSGPAISNGGYVGLRGVFGSGSVTTLKAKALSVTVLPSAIGSMTVTATGQDILVEGTPFPAFTAGAALPATATLTSWAHLYGAPYSGYMQTTTGALVSALAIPGT